MRTSIIALVLPALLAVGCAANGEDSSTSGADLTSTPCASAADAKKGFEAATSKATDTITKAYDAALKAYNDTIAASLATHDADMATAKAQLDAALGGFSSNSDANAMNGALADYNAKIGTGGPIDTAYKARNAQAKSDYDAAVAKAKGDYDAATKAATADYNASVCRPS